MKWARNLKFHETETETEALCMEHTLSADFLDRGRSQFDARRGDKYRLRRTLCAWAPIQHALATSTRVKHLMEDKVHTFALKRLENDIS